jgi:hypothetical protein
VRALCGGARAHRGLVVGAARRVSAQQEPEERVSQQDQKLGHGKVELLHVQGNVYMIAGAGANITVQVGDRFVIVVDSGVPQMSEEVLAAIRSVTDKHILFIIDTSADGSHGRQRELIKSRVGLTERKHKSSGAGEARD